MGERPSVADGHFYALGSTLYELLTRQAAFLPAGMRIAIMMQVRGKGPVAMD